MKRLTNGKVILYSILFILLMGLVGTVDRETAQAVLDEQVNIRDAVKERFEREWSEDQARAELLGKGQ